MPIGQPRAESLDQPAEQRGYPRRQLGLAFGAIGIAGAVGGINHRRVRQDRAGRLEDAEAAHARIEEEERGGGIHCWLG